VDRLAERLAIADRALETLREINLDGDVTPRDRDAAIIRFIYTFEAVWKAAQQALADREGVDARTPKSSIRAALESGMLTADQTEAALIAANDRNLAVHTYNEELAHALLTRLPAHAEVLGAWLTAMQSRSADPA